MSSKRIIILLVYEVVVLCAFTIGFPMLINIFSKRLTLFIVVGCIVFSLGIVILSAIFGENWKAKSKKGNT